MNQDRNFPMEYSDYTGGFSMRSITHSFDSAPSCIKGYTMALMQGKKGNEILGYPFISVLAADEETARYLGIETRAAMRLFIPNSQPLQTSVLDVIWSHVAQDPSNLKGISGARSAAEALKKCCENFPRINK